MKLGGAIGPSPESEIDRTLRNAVEGILQEKGVAAAALREIIEKQSQILEGLQDVVANLRLSSEAQAQAALSLARQTVQPAPKVDVRVEEREQEAPVVHVAAPDVVVQRGAVRKTVHRNPDGTIDYVMEEPV